MTTPELLQWRLVTCAYVFRGGTISRFVGPPILAKTHLTEAPLPSGQPVKKLPLRVPNKRSHLFDAASTFNLRIQKEGDF